MRFVYGKGAGSLIKDLANIAVINIPIKIQISDLDVVKSSNSYF